MYHTSIDPGFKYQMCSDPGIFHGSFDTFVEAMVEAYKYTSESNLASSVWQGNVKVAVCYPKNWTMPWICEDVRFKEQIYDIPEFVKTLKEKICDGL